MRWMIVAAIALSWWTARAAEPVIDFAAPAFGEDRFSLVFKGSPPNHTCVDQILKVAPNGDWVVLFTTGGVEEPEIDNHIRLVRSTNGGRSWSDSAEVLRLPDRACTFSEMVVHDGVITVFVQTHDGHFGDWRVFTITSPDSGMTWTKPVRFELTPRRAFLRNLYVTSWGEWVLPLQTYDVTKNPALSPQQDGSHRLCMNGALVSDDQGKTWTRSRLVGPTPGWAENNIVELSDGRLVMLIRADGKGYLVRSESTDRGRTWSKPVATDIPNPGAKFRLFRLSDGRIALLHNPNPLTKHPNSRKAAQVHRNPLSLWVSDDDMKTWGSKRSLVHFPGMLAYPDGFVDEKAGYIHFVFDYNRHDVIYWAAKLPPATSP